LDEYEDDLDKLLLRIERAQKEKRALSIGYLGNVVDLWEKLATSEISVDLGSDQTSLHIPFSGGYYPVGLSLAASLEMMVKDPDGFKKQVQASLCRQVRAIHVMHDRGMRFWDYGNAFLLEASRAKAPDIMDENGHFRYPSYVEDIMGPIIFDYGFGPFRWVCTSADPTDLAQTDRLALNILEKQVKTADPETRQQLLDNILWIKEAARNSLVVGSKARILYADRRGRTELALAFNDAIAQGSIKAPIVLGRDHHDVSGTDSPFRETADITDGSKFTADMAVHNFVGDAFRGATWVSLHNGGGVGFGEAINGGFGLVLDGTEEASRKARSMLSWDVTNGLARRAWAGSRGAAHAAQRAMEADAQLEITLPSSAETELIEKALRG
jgi:urocanate hydratase